MRAASTYSLLSAARVRSLAIKQRPREWGEVMQYHGARWRSVSVVCLRRNVRGEYSTKLIGRKFFPGSGGVFGGVLAFDAGFELPTRVDARHFHTPSFFHPLCHADSFAYRAVLLSIMPCEIGIIHSCRTDGNICSTSPANECSGSIPLAHTKRNAGSCS